MAALPVAYFVIRNYKTFVSIEKHEEKKETRLGPVFAVTALPVAYFDGGGFCRQVYWTLGGWEVGRMRVIA